MIVINALRILGVISRYQILTHAGKINIPFKVKIVGKLLELIFYPVGLFRSPNKDFGYRLARCFRKLGPIYIKLGQTLSTRPDLIGVGVANELKYLQDRLPPFDGEIAKNIISKSLDKNIEELFLEFEEVAIAAGSISQVHKAKLHNGEDVAVKVLRPEIHKKYNNDIKLLYILARLSNKFFKKMKRLKPVEVIKIFETTMKQELNLKLEAAAASELADNFALDNEIYIPKVYWQYTTEEVLCIEWVNGTSIYDTNKLIEIGLDPLKVSKKIAIMFFNQAYRDGFFHADLHPGNIFVKDSGIVVLIDFGIMGRLKERDRLAVAEILAAFLSRDYKQVADIHIRVGYVPEDTDPYIFAQNCRAVCEPIVGLAIKDVSIGKLLLQLFKITEDFGMETQSQLLLLQKTMVIVEGIGQSLNPNINMWELAEPWIKKWGAKNISPEAKMLRVLKNMISDFIEDHYKKNGGV
jgi:ubiquinone biosynthesis protein